MGELTPKQQAFVNFYLQKWNGAEAARLAGCSAKSARQTAHDWLTNPDIREHIKRRLADLQMTADEVLVRLTEQARASMADFVVIRKDGSLRVDLAKARRAKRLHLIKKLKPTKYGWEIELYDAQAALTQLGRHHALFVDKVAPTDPHGEREYSGGELTDEGRIDRIVAILDTARARRDRQTTAGGGHSETEGGG